MKNKLKSKIYNNNKKFARIIKRYEPSNRNFVLSTLNKSILCLFVMLAIYVILSDFI